MLKLNLGCGNKAIHYLPENGWLNIDIVTPKEFPEAYGYDFLESDLRDLQLQDNVADEAHGYHIIEHFYRSEVLGVLKEWKRVLKPGGIVVLEQPDILKCAANLLLGVVKGDAKLIHNYGILGMFGDGTPEEPFMGHHWGWDPSSLGTMMVEAGFVSIRQEPAQTHAMDDRDFRMVGVKPHE